MAADVRHCGQQSALDVIGVQIRVGRATVEGVVVSVLPLIFATSYVFPKAIFGVIRNNQRPRSMAMASPGLRR